MRAVRFDFAECHDWEVEDDVEPDLELLHRHLYFSPFFSLADQCGGLPASMVAHVGGLILEGPEI